VRIQAQGLLYSPHITGIDDPQADSDEELDCGYVMDDVGEGSDELQREAQREWKRELGTRMTNGRQMAMHPYDMHPYDVHNGLHVLALWM
jgi:hypothetical protein